MKIPGANLIDLALCGSFFVFADPISAGGMIIAYCGSLWLVMKLTGRT